MVETSDLLILILLMLTILLNVINFLSFHPSPIVIMEGVVAGVIGSVIYVLRLLTEEA